MIRGGFLSDAERQALTAMARDGLAEHRIARRANAIVLPPGCGAPKIPAQQVMGPPEQIAAGFAGGVFFFFCRAPRSAWSPSPAAGFPEGPVSSARENQPPTPPRPLLERPQGGCTQQIPR